LVLLITTQLSVDLILLAGLTTLLVFGIIDAEVALAGFSNEGMLTVAALYVVAAGLKETGAIQRITQRLLGNTENVRTAQALEQKLWAASKQTMLLDGDQVRHGLCGDLGFSPEERSENIRRVGHLAKLFYEHGNIVLCSFVSPYAKDRDAVKALFSEADFVELYMQSSIEIRQQRDPKGLYAKAKSGEITGIHGYDLAFEEPSSPDFVLNTDENNPQELVQKVFEGIFG
jgi:adenylyl-sulfate kinase